MHSLPCCAATARNCFAQDDDLSKLKFVVIKDYNGKPIRNASVVLHPVAKNGNRNAVAYSLSAILRARPVMTACLMARYGAGFDAGVPNLREDYDIDKPEMEITIKLKRPVEQYSIYTDNKK